MTRLILSTFIGLFFSFSPAMAAVVRLDEGDSRLLMDRLVYPFSLQRDSITKRFGDRILEGIQWTRKFTTADGLLAIECSSANIAGGIFDPKCIFTFDLNKSAQNTAKMATDEVLLADITVPKDVEDLFVGIPTPGLDKLGVGLYQTLETVVVKAPSGEKVQIPRLIMNCENKDQQKSCRFRAVTN
jgi:hypothetical protein